MAENQRADERKPSALMEGPLAGVKVLDVSTVLAAPITATILGDFGADVVKVEEPGVGDFTRGAVPGARSPQWAQEGRNKRSVTLNLRHEKGRELLRRLIPHFDVVIFNNRPATLDSWGLGAGDVTKLSERTVFVYLTGYGLTGPYRDRGAFDRIASSFAGLTYVSGDADRPPVRTGYSLIDFMSAYLAAFGSMAALYERDLHSGQGQVLDLALFEAGFRASEDALLRYSLTGEVRERQGNSSPHIVPASDFETADAKRVSLHAGTDPLFRRLATAMGRSELGDDPRFSNRSARVDNASELYEIISAWAQTLDCELLMKLLVEAEIPASPVMSVADIYSDIHYRERGTIVDVNDKDFGMLSMASVLPRLSRTPGSIRFLGPDLGESTETLYSELLNLSAEEIAQLRDSGTV